MQQQPVWLWFVQQRIEYNAKIQFIGSAHADHSVLWTNPDVGGDGVFVAVHAIRDCSGHRYIYGVGGLLGDFTVFRCDAVVKILCFQRIELRVVAKLETKGEVARQR